MIFKTKTFWVISILFIFSSCGIFRDKNLAKRYRNNWNSRTFANSEEPQKFVTVDLHSILVNSSQEKEIKFNVLSLNNQGQEAFINSVNDKSSTGQQFLDLLSSNFNFSKEDKPKIKIIPKTIKKTLIFTVDRLKYHRTLAIGAIPPVTTFNNLGDRVSFLELSVKLPPGTNAIFNSWDKYVTDKITLNLGKVSSAQNWNASLNLSAKGAAEASLSGSNTTEDFTSDKGLGTTTLINTGTGNSSTNTNNYELLSTGKEAGTKANSLKASGELGGSATLGYSDKYETSLELSSQILQLSGTLAENQILLRQEGGPGIDLSGNIVVSVEYTITDDWAPPLQYFKVKNLYTAGMPILPSALSTSYLTLIYPDIQRNITGHLDYSFLYRQVNKGNKHLPEARHKVKYRYGNVSYLQNNLTNHSPVDLVRTQDIRPKVYLIRVNRGGSNLQFNGSDMRFETTSEAAIFLAYLKELALNGMSFTPITEGGRPLTLANISNLQLITTQL